MLIRPGLEARISRPVFYEMVALAETEVIDGRRVLGVWSKGMFFPVGDHPEEEAGDLEDVWDEDSPAG